MYNASKAAVRGYSDALREELRADGIAVLCVHPGGVKTNIVNRARVADTALIATDAAAMRRDFDRVASLTPAQAARRIIGAIERRQPRLLVGADAHLLDLIYRAFPGHASRWLALLARRRMARGTR